jgi:hypothetical protein
MDKPNCYECKHRGEVPGSAHSSCNHPDAKNESNLLGLFAVMSGGNMPQESNYLIG